MPWPACMPAFPGSLFDGFLFAVTVGRGHNPAQSRWHHRARTAAGSRTPPQGVFVRTLPRVCVVLVRLFALAQVVFGFASPAFPVSKERSMRRWLAASLVVGSAVVLPSIASAQAAIA